VVEVACEIVEEVSVTDGASSATVGVLVVGGACGEVVGASVVDTASEMPALLPSLQAAIPSMPTTVSDLIVFFNAFGVRRPLAIHILYH